MKFITEPSVELIAVSDIDYTKIRKFIDQHNQTFNYEGTPLDLIESAGRTCYMSFGKGRSHADFIKHIIEVGHGSVLEHVQFTFQMWGISRSLSHELVRHRAGFAFSQLSQRYVDSSDVNFIVPQAIQELDKMDAEYGHSSLSEFQAFCRYAANAYSQLTETLFEFYKDIPDKTERRKKARQAARSVLPNATETIMTVSMNARAFRHFVEMRASAQAEVEIRALAVKVFDIINERWPLLCHGMEKVTLKDGSYGITSKYRKV